jgi:quinoprotein glucose dehydrogenase
MRRSRLVPAAVAALGLLSLAGLADDKPYTPKVLGPSNEAEQAVKRFRLPKGVEGSVWAAEPLLANPVSFSFDERGRCYVAETFRLGHGVTDDRSHMNWLDDDLASRTVADRVALHKKYAGARFERDYETEHDRVKLVWDGKGTGHADQATVFADGFRHAAQGIGAGVLARRGGVYYTCIPDLWLLKDTKGEGKADVRQSLATGFGVHVSFIGHDMHGLRMGPDGRLYFSIGDRGFNVTTKEGKQLFNPDSGAVLRCDPDGSNLEIVHTGLRNPQELAFDPHGNLFTVDNNSDSGDRARLVQIVEGGDSGWRIGYQYGSDMGDRGPFNAEKVWHLPPTEQPAYIVPPLAHITSGPSGLCFNYGATALPSRYADHFFICDFHGSPNGSGAYSFAVKPKGASFEVADGHMAFGNVLATDCDFGPDGGFYISDWVDGWGLTGKGRIYRFADPEAAKNPEIAEVKKLLAEGFDKRSNEDLAKLLEHPDMRVRQEAQFALAAKGKEAIPTLTRSASEGKNQLARLHAVWGLGQIARKEETARESLAELGKVEDADVRCQVAKTLGGLGHSALLVQMLADKDARVRFEAGISLSRSFPEGLGPHVADKPLMFEAQAHRAIVEMLRENADRDPYLRHAGVMALARYPHELLKFSYTDESPAVRLAVVLALRRQRSKDIARFLDDREPRIATEAARAIHDEPIPDALPALAAMLDKPSQSEFLLWRALNANLRLGGEKNAAAVAHFAGNSAAPEKLRAEAVKMLGLWGNPGRRDRVTGLTQDLGKRDPAAATEALKGSLGAIFSGPNAVRREAARVAASLGIKEVGPALYEMAADTKRPAAVRVEMLRALEALKDSRLEEATRLALHDGEPHVRAEGRRLLTTMNPEQGTAALTGALKDGTLIEKQSALAVLGGLKSDAAAAALGQSLDRLLAKDYPPEQTLDLLEAAAKQSSLKVKLAKYEASRPKGDHLAAYRESLEGGDPEAGRSIFFTKTEVSCLRCHKVKGEGGDVGPDLTGIGGKQKRDYLLESIVDPNKQIAQGFETVVLTLTSGKVVSGIVKGEDAKEVKLMTAEGQLLTVPKAKIDERARGKSAMPEDLIQHLSKREVRDLVEFLANLK